MSLSKKKSRPITVDGKVYRFQVSTTKNDDKWNKLNLTIQCVEENGSCLQVTGLLTRDFWLDFPDLKNEKDKEHYPVIKPGHVKRIIRMGISKGWIPEKQGSLFNLELENDEIFT